MAQQNYISLIFTASCLLIALASYRFLLVPFVLVFEHMAHYRLGFSLPLWGHLIFGPIALAALPVQVHAGLRARRPGLHRMVGRIAAASMLIGGVSALAMLPAFKGSTFATSGFATLGTLWIAFTLIAVQAARTRDFSRHRAFMLRASALTFGAVTLRIIMAPLMASGWTPTETYDITAWGCWVPLLMMVEFWLARQSKRAPAGAL